MSVNQTLVGLVNGLSKYQIDYHYGVDSPVAHNHSDVGFRIYPSATVPVETTGGIISSNSAKFNYNSDFSFALGSYMMITLPEIEINPKWTDSAEVAWTDKPAHTIFASSSLFFGENKNIQTLDTHSYNVLFQFYRDSKPGYDALYKLAIGDIPPLTKWNSFLPKYTLLFPVPFAYSKSEANNLQLLYLRDKDQPYESYTLKRMLGDILRVRIKTKDDNGKEKWVESLLKDIEDVDHLSLFTNKDITSTALLPNPRHIVQYDKLHADDEHWHLHRHEAKFEDSWDRKLYYTDIISFQSSGAGVLGDKLSVTVDTPWPVKAINWMVQSVTCINQGKFSCYVTPEKYDPCSNFSIRVGNNDLVTDMDPRLSRLLFPLSQSNSCQLEDGYHGFSFNNAPFSQDCPFGVQHQGGITLTVKLSDSHLYHKSSNQKLPTGQELRIKDRSKPQNDEKYILIVRALVIRNYEFQVVGDTISGCIVPQNPNQLSNSVSRIFPH